jgi:hypothetical protein
MRLPRSPLVVAIFASSLMGQQPPDSVRLPPVLRIPSEREIALAKSAAPAIVSDSAEIWVLGKRGYEKTITGTNGYGCIVQRGMGGQSLIPRCDDPSGVANLFPIYQMIETMRADGRSYGDFRRQLADAYATGKLRPPTHGGFSYMYSGDAFFTTSTGQRVEFTPHVMVYWPNCTTQLLGMSKSEHMRGTGLGFVDYGTPECTLIINTPPATVRRVAERDSVLRSTPK